MLIRHRHRHLRQLLVLGLSLIFASSSGSGHSTTCDPLSYRIGVKTNCEHPITRESINCRSDRAPVGTIATYKCEDGYYVVPQAHSPSQSPGEEVGLEENGGGKIKCGTQGEWNPRNSLHGFSCQIDCGKPGSITKWPWHAAIFSRRSERDSFSYSCGGTLLNPANKGFAILTTSNCFSASTPGMKPTNIRVALGLTSQEFVRNEESNYARVYRVNKISTHPRHGLTLLNLEEDIVLDETVNPICLTSASIPLEGRTHAPQLIGFGSGGSVQEAPSAEGSNERTLRKIDLHPRTCLASTPKARATFCMSGGLKGINGGVRDRGGRICTDDIGGGLTVPSSSDVCADGAEKPIRYTIQGVLSDLEESRDLSVSGACSKSGVFTYVANYTTWISEQVERFNSDDEVAEVVNVLPEEATTIRLAFHRETTAPSPPRRASTPTSTLTPIIPPTDPALGVSHRPTASGSNSNSRLPRPRPTIRNPQIVIQPTSTSTPTLRPSRRTTTTTTEPTLDSRNPSDYEQVGLDWHNFYRRKHGVPEVILSDHLNEESQKEAEQWLENHRFEFTGVTNWFAFTRANLDSSQAAKQAVRDWYKSMSAYNWTSSYPEDLPFTHIVWKSTSEIGIGVARRGEDQIVVAKYLRPLFFEHEREAVFQENVLRPQQDV